VRDPARPITQSTQYGASWEITRNPDYPYRTPINKFLEKPSENWFIEVLFLTLKKKSLII
jgi:hypothetical protein